MLGHGVLCSILAAHVRSPAPHRSLPEPADADRAATPGALEASWRELRCLSSTLVYPPCLIGRADADVYLPAECSIRGWRLTGRWGRYGEAPVGPRAPARADHRSKVAVVELPATRTEPAHPTNRRDRRGRFNIALDASSPPPAPVQRDSRARIVSSSVSSVGSGQP